MLNLNLQFFAHKKGVGSTKNGRELISFYKLQIFGFGAFCNIETKQRKNGD